MGNRSHGQWGTWAMGPMGHGAYGQWGPWDNSVHGVWDTGGIGHMGHGAYGQWGHRGYGQRASHFNKSRSCNLSML